MNRENLLRRIRSKFGERIADAFSRVPRELFVPPEYRHLAYADTALPIGRGATISQPTVIAEMLTLLDPRPGEKILEIGTGSGYTAALLAELGTHVISIEIDPVLAEQAKERLTELGYDVKVIVGDGSEGYLPDAPYDGIICHAATPRIPLPWVEQLKEGGKIVAPVGDRHYQVLALYRKKRGEIVLERRGSPVVFIPLLGKYGFGDDEDPK